MNILIFGATGFIGQDFINRFSQKFSKIYVLTRDKEYIYNFSNIEFVATADIENLTNISCVLHFAFDHSYRENIKLAEYAFSSCYQNKCSLIYLSSFVVRDILSGKSLKGSLSKLNDPYTIEKIRVKKHLEMLFHRSNLNMLQIEPGIVYGMQGGWYDHAIDALSYNSILLTNSGKNISSFIYVGELSSYIYKKVIEGELINESVLVASDLIKNWNDFYCLYGQLKNQEPLIENLESKRLHSNYIFHILMKILIFTNIGKALFKITPPMKSYFKKLFGSRGKKKSLSQSQKIGSYRSYGITYLLQSVDLKKNMHSNFNDFTKISTLKDYQILDEMKYE